MRVLLLLALAACGTDRVWHCHVITYKTEGAAVMVSTDCSRETRPFCDIIPCVDAPLAWCGSKFCTLQQRDCEGPGNEWCHREEP